jgi:two-component system NtrC family sensor kinase
MYYMESDPRILLVDDEASVLSSLQRLFRRSGYRVTTCGSGREGLAAFDSNGPFNLVISDYRMPEMNGVEFLSVVRSKWPETMRIVLSGFADTSAIISATNEGNIYKFIPKPWDETFLLDSVREALAAHERAQGVNTQLHELSGTLNTMETTYATDIIKHQQVLHIYHTLLDQIPVGIVGVDSEMLIVSMNSRAQSLLGLSIAPLGELAGRVLPGIFDGGGLDSLADSMIIDVHEKQVQVLFKKLQEGTREGIMMILVLLDSGRC